MENPMDGERTFIRTEGTMKGHSSMEFHMELVDLSWKMAISIKVKSSMAGPTEMDIFKLAMDSTKELSKIISGMGMDKKELKN
jgi:hypothetical protein